MKLGSSFRLCVSCVVSVALSFPSHYAMADESGSEDLSQAFSNLRVQMKNTTSVKPGTPTQNVLDSALDDAFEILPEPVKNSAISLDAITPQAAQRAVSELNPSTINDQVLVDYEGKGVALSLLLWSGTEKHLKSVVTNIIKQHYTHLDPRNIRVVVNSNPLPKIKSTPEIDLNAEKRKKAEEKYKRELEKWSGRSSLFSAGAKFNFERPEIPVRMGLEIEINAGFIARCKNMDEFVAGIAYSMAKNNPKLIEAKADPIFLKYQDVLSMIDAIVDGTENKNAAHLRLTRDQVIAELSTMERLLAAGFHPMALYNYYRDVYIWFADVFEKNPNHVLGRFLLRNEEYSLVDYTRTLRLQLMERYLSFLQTKGRVKSENLNFHKFDKTMSKIRFRLALYSRSFFVGTAAQASPFVLAGGLAATHYFFPEFAHWAMSAVSVSHSADVPAVPEAIEATSKLSHQFSELRAKVTDTVVNSPLMESLDFTSRWSDSFKQVNKELSQFVDLYKIGIGLAVAGATGYAVARYHNVISAALKTSQIKKMRSQDGGDNANQEPLSNDDELKESLSNLEVEMHRSGISENERRNLLALTHSGIELARRMKSGSEVIWRRMVGIVEQIPSQVDNGWTVTVDVAGRKIQAGQEKLKIAKEKTAQRAQELPGQIGNGWNTAVSATSNAASVAVDAGGRAIRSGGRGTVAALKLGKEAVVASKKATAEFGNALVFEYTPKAAGYTADKIGEAFTSTYEAGVRSVNWVEAQYEEKKARDAIREEGLAKREKIFSEGTNEEKINYLVDWGNVIGGRSVKYGSNLEYDVDYSKRGIRAAFKTYWKYVALWGQYEAEKSPPELVIALMHFFDERFRHPSHEHFDGLSGIESFEHFELMKPVIEILQSRSDKRIVDYLQNSLAPRYQAELERSYYLKMLLTKKMSYEGSKENKPELLEASVARMDVFSRDRVTKDFLKNQKDVINWVLRDGAQPSEIHHFFNQLEQLFRGDPHSGISILKMTHALEVRSPFMRIFKQLSPDQRIRFFSAVEGNTPEKWANRFGTMKIIEASFVQIIQGLMDSSQSIVDFNTKLTEYVSKNKLKLNLFQPHLQGLILTRLDLLKSYRDFDLLMRAEHFWPDQEKMASSTVIEEPLRRILDEKRKSFGGSVWKYDPVVSERIHRQLENRMQSLGILQNDYNSKFHTWKLLTDRGVSTITDEMLENLVKLADSKQLAALEQYAVAEGRVFDQELSNKFALSQIKASPSYNELVFRGANLKDVDRMGLIYNVVEIAQNLMKDMGNSYSIFIENLSVSINSSFAEAELLNQFKTKKIMDTANRVVKGNDSEGFGLFESILPEIKSWKPKHQFEFLLYLRGSIDATPFITSQFPVFGPERIRKMFQGLPVKIAMGVVNLYLKETILSRKSVDEGYGKKLIDTLISEIKDPTVEKFAGLMIRGLLFGLDRAKNPYFKDHVLSAIVALRAGNQESTAKKVSGQAGDSSEVSNVGEILKTILEQFPGVGPKIGQFLVGTGRLPDHINDVLSETQDKALPPERYDQYMDLAQITGRGKDIGIILEQLLGSGSIKYSFLGKDQMSGLRLALQVFREDVQNNSDMQVEVLQGMIDYLIKEGGKEWAFLRVIVDGAVNAVQREKRYKREAHKTMLARLRIYQNFSSSQFTIQVPEQQMNNDRLLMSRFAKGVSFKELPQQDKDIVGKKLLEMESSVLFGNSRQGGGKDRSVIWYDTDRHAGNYLIDVVFKNGQKHYNIWPIDFGQLTYIRHEQRDRVAELFALAGILSDRGTNDWIGNHLASLFKFNAKTTARFKENLKQFFPPSLQSKENGSQDKIIMDYFSLIAAINESMRDPNNGQRYADVNLNEVDFDVRSGKLDYAYTDFVRAIIQLNQYEEKITLVDDRYTPRNILKELSIKKAAKILSVMDLDTTQKIALSTVEMGRKAKAFFTGEKFSPTQWRLTEDELRRRSFMSRSKDSRLGSGGNRNACLQFYRM